MAYLKQNPDLLKGDNASIKEAERLFRDFTPAAPTVPTVIGFMWNDFTLFSDEPAFANNPDRAHVFGRQAVQYLLKHAGEGKTRLHAVMRAHQHSGIPNPMMRRLIAGRGLFRHWQETNSMAAREATSVSLASKIETRVTRPIPEGSVWTFNVIPDSIYGTGLGYDFATFGLLSLQEKFEDWRMEVGTVTPPGL